MAQEELDISLGLHGLTLVQDCRVSVGVQRASDWMQRFSQLVRNPEETADLLDWEIHRVDRVFGGFCNKRSVLILGLESPQSFLASQSIVEHIRPGLRFGGHRIIMVRMPA
jgi:hypothetical protein